ncbi:FecR family protein [Polaribacter sp. IC073]|uniref:FecR family protein n=1 Tax=Polaribacter sp. IC073 TaxID=2508540 RepID=UPI0011BDC2D0|nr:FecR family protein [Polaribacter sp. IC073]TXD46746.1 FecR family protein [Polaribacter sp. IC073]
MNTSEAKILFTKYTNNQCSEKEIELLEAYLDSYQTKGSKNTTINESKTKVWQNIVGTIDTQPKKKKKFPFNTKNVLKIAASITLLFILSVVIKNYSKESSFIFSEEPMVVGSDKATLTLEDGTAVALEKGKKYESKNINSNGVSLVYDAASEKVTEEIAYNYLTVPNGGQFFVTLSDGTKVWLNSATKLKYPVKFKQNAPREVELVYGEAYFEVTSSTKNKGATFKVISKRQNIEVLGTEFNVKDYQDETITYTTLVEGKIALNTKEDNQVLIPNQQATVNMNTGVIVLHTVDVYNEISWKDGVFSFKGKNLKEIMKVLSRWYDLEVVFNNKDLETTKFKGVLSKKQPIEEILKAIKSASIITSFKIENKTIYLE